MPVFWRMWGGGGAKQCQQQQKSVLLLQGSVKCGSGTSYLLSCRFGTGSGSSSLQSDRNLRPLVYRPSRPLLWASTAFHGSILSLSSFWILTLMRIRIKLFTLTWIRIQLPKMMRIRISNAASLLIHVSYLWVLLLSAKYFPELGQPLPVPVHLVHPPPPVCTAYSYHRVLAPPPSQRGDIAKPYQCHVMQRSCARCGLPYKRKCWKNSTGPLYQSLLWDSYPKRSCNSQCCGSGTIYSGFGLGKGPDPDLFSSFSNKFFFTKPYLFNVWMSKQ